MNEEEFIKSILPEIYWRTSRSGGKGGQHVNKTESRVELLFDFMRSSAFTEEEKARLQKQVPAHFSDGTIRLVSQSSRSQHQNKEENIKKLYVLIQKALFVKKKRKASRPSKAAIQKKRKSKEHRSAIKKNRSRKSWNND